jgi:predicted nucleic acid-binding protein
VTEAVLDASVVLKWFHMREEPNLEAAHLLRARFEEGQLNVAAPPLLMLELLNVAGRRWGWPAGEVVDFAANLSALRFGLIEPELASVANWAGRGLTAYDAAYIALAEQLGVPLVTDDRELIAVARTLVVPLAQVSNDL